MVASWFSFLYIPRVPGQLANRSNILRLLGITVQCESLRDLPYEDLSIVGARGDNRIIEGIPRQVSATPSPTSPHPPICIQHRRRMSSEKRDLLRESALLADRYNSKRASTTGLPIDGEVFRVCLSRQLSSLTPAQLLPSPNSCPTHCD